MKRVLPANEVLSVRRQSIPVVGSTSAPFSIHPFFRTVLFSLKAIGVAILFFGSINNISAQQDSEQLAAYKKTIHERVTKIVNTLNISDPVFFDKTVTIISNQYFSLNDIHENSKTAVAAIKLQSLSIEDKDAQLKKEDAKKTEDLLKLHGAFLTALKKNLSTEQIEKVKDGMTYRVMPITYEAYLDMLPRLTEEQKTKLYAWLQEARELAMDAESSEKKHAVFGKYKGRINNYLSAAGIDMKKEGEDWQKRIKEREAAKAK